MMLGKKITTETHLVTWKNQIDSKTLIHKEPMFYMLKKSNIYSGVIFTACFNFWSANTSLIKVTLKSMVQVFKRIHMYLLCTLSVPLCANRHVLIMEQQGLAASQGKMSQEQKVTPEDNTPINQEPSPRGP